MSRARSTGLVTDADLRSPNAFLAISDFPRITRSLGLNQISLRTLRDPMAAACDSISGRPVPPLPPAPSAIARAWLSPAARQRSGVRRAVLRLVLRRVEPRHVHAGPVPSGTPPGCTRVGNRRRIVHGPCTGEGSRIKLGGQFDSILGEGLLCRGRCRRQLGIGGRRTVMGCAAAQSRQECRPG